MDTTLDEAKTSTFTVHHNRCKPETWTPKDLMAFADFVKTGNLLYAPHLSRLGVQLVLSEHHVPKGGVIEEVGIRVVADKDTIFDNLNEAVEHGDEDVTPVQRVYVGPVEYAVRYGIGDGEGNFEGYEYDLKPTEAEAQAYLDDRREPEAAAPEEPA